ncbi:MAG: FAD-dependent oxidoreductase, partial [Candidatus Obscuribacterales bacterium]|nr:FAD-dependent oxidoreductase [Candidatus Obscuribacterales bacterium]
GLNVLLVSDGHPGGECLWSGCVPSKALIHKAAETKVLNQNAKGLKESSFHQAMKHMRDSRKQLSHHDSVETVQATGVKVKLGRATFIDRNVISIDGQLFRANKFVIATGASQRVPDIVGLEQAGYLTHESILQIEEAPRKIAIIGGGPVGVEYSQVLIRLGIDVTLIEANDRILTKEEPESSAFVANKLQSENVEVLLSTTLLRVERLDTIKRLKLRRENGQEVEVDCSEILLASGKTPNTEDLHLGLAGVELDQRGFIKVDKHQRTSAPHVWACGDVCGGYQFTHYADHAARTAVLNACLGLPVKREERVIPWCTFFDPEVAHVGMTEAQAIEKHGKGKIYCLTYKLDEFDRAVLDEAAHGFIKVIIDKKGKIYGASIVGQRAGELIHEFALAMKHGLSIKDLGSLIHVYPTMSAAIRNVSNQYYQTVMKNSWQSKIVKLWAACLK